MMFAIRKTYSAIVLAWLLLGAAAFIQGCGKDVPPQPVVTSFKYEPAKTLSPEERDVETRFATAIQDNLNVFIAAYRWKWPKVVNTDNARELSRDYAPDGFESMTENTKEHRLKYTLATQGPSRSLAVEVYKQMLREQPTGTTQPLVVFTAGGAGSGKSTSIGALPELRNIMDQAQIVFDTTLSSQDSPEQIKMALDAGKTVKIFYIYRDAEMAFTGMLERTVRTGRPVTLTNFITTHLGTPKMLDSVANIYGEEIKAGKISISVIDNTGALQDVKVAQGGMNFVRARVSQYDGNELRERLQKTLDEAYADGKISKQVYDAVNQ